MVEFSQLLLPILLSAVFVFFASSLIHMVIQWHNAEYGKLANEDALRATFNQIDLPPGQYIIPHCTDPKEGASPEMMKKFEEGPVAMIFVKPKGAMKLGPFLGKWFVYTLVMSAIVAYVTKSQLLAGAESMAVFQLAGVTAWLGYCWASPADSIWMGRPWIVTIKHMVDGLVYAVATAGTFVWMWPAAV